MGRTGKAGRSPRSSRAGICMVRRRGSGACPDTRRSNRPCAITTSTHSVFPTPRLRPSLTQSNRRGTDPYARWWGRGGTARGPPIPIHDPTRTFGDTLAAPREGPFGVAYTTAFTNFANLKKYYIDDLSGPGIHISRTTKPRIEGESSAHAESDAAIRRLLFRRPQRRQTLSHLPARPDRGEAFRDRRLKVGAVSIAAVPPTAGAPKSA